MFETDKDTENIKIVSKTNADSQKQAAQENFKMGLGLVVGIVVIVLILWIGFRWWFGSSETVPIYTETKTAKTVEETGQTYQEIAPNLLLDLDTKDVISCTGEIPASCVHTEYNCQNVPISSLSEDTEAYKNCVSNKEPRREPPDTFIAVPNCNPGERIWVDMTERKVIGYRCAP